MLIYDFIFSRKITECVFSLSAFHLYRPLIALNLSLVPPC